MSKEVRKREKAAAQEPRRDSRMVCYVSAEEMHIVDRYLARYHISNKGRWMRETLLASISQSLEEDYPTLFHEHDMRRG